MILFLFLLSFLAYLLRYQIWNMKYKLTKYRLKISAFQPSDDYIYHAFVSYSSADEEWVANELVKKLEHGDTHDGKPIKLCLHERDFQIGRPISENIVLSLEQSACCILVLSAKFTKSYWCNFEAHVAHQMFQDENRVDNLVRVHSKIYCS